MRSLHEVHLAVTVNMVSLLYPVFAPMVCTCCVALQLACFCCACFKYTRD